MIALVQGISEIGAGTQPSPPEPFDLPDDVDTLLFELELGEFSHKTIHLVKSLIGSRKIVYVSYNKLPKYIKSKFEDAGIAKDKISFLNCTKSDTGVDVHASPESLTEISYTIKDQNTPDVKTVVVVDAVNRFITYFEESELLSFLGSLNDDAREKHYQIIWLLVSGDLPKSFSTKVAQLCDEYRVG